MSGVFVFSIFALVNYVITQDQPSHFPEEKCESLLDGCSCNFIDAFSPSVKIICDNLTDFSNFSRILDEIVDFDVAFSMDFYGIKSFPARLLEGLKIYELTINSPDAVSDQNILEGVTSLKQFIVKRSDIKDVPDFSYVRDSIETITISSSSLSSLGGSSLQNLTSAKYLSFFNNSIRFIDPDVFEETENVVNLDLSRNMLTSIPSLLLYFMRNLTEFHASYNNLLHLNNVFIITWPKFIILNNNNITKIGSILHLNMQEVETLALDNNPLKTISADSFKQKIPNIVNLQLSNCELQEFNAEAFSNLNKLETLDLSKNFIEVIGNTANYGAVYKLILSHNKLQNLKNFPQKYRVSELELNNNQIQYLTEEDFEQHPLIEISGYRSFKTLDLQTNKIERIDTQTFVKLKKKLAFLNLAHNFIKTLNGSIRNLYSLRLLNLADNLIATFGKGEFQGLNELNEIYLQGNKIKALSELRPIPHITHASVQNNSIETIAVDEVPQFLESLDLEGNPIKCDCRMHRFLLLTNKTIFTDRGVCLKKDVVNGLEKMSNCPKMCTCECVQTEDISFMFADCSSRNLSSTPQFFNNRSSQIGGNATSLFGDQQTLMMVQNKYPLRHLKDRVLGINLEDNSLEVIDASQLPFNLIQLHLANNRLTRFPDFILNNLLNLKNISLSGNPWICDCDAVKFKRWVTSNYAIISDLNDTRCGNNKDKSHLDGRVLWTLTDLDICPNSLGWIVLSVISCLIFLFSCLAVKILYKTYELHIRAFLWFHGVNFVKEEDTEIDKPFDAFLSFSNMDGEFVTREIIREVERKNPNVRLCIHYRDFRAGEFIYDNILHAIRNSKRTVFILSKNFLESEWCLMEFRTAHVQALEDRMHRIVVIKVGELPEDIDQSIKVYLESTTYLTWGEYYFWKKFLYILPSSSSVRDPVPKKKEEIEMI